MPFQSTNYNLHSSMQQSWNVLGTRRGRLETCPSSAMSRDDPLEVRTNETSGGPCLRRTLLEIQIGSRSSMASEAKELVEVEKKMPLHGK
jgi:hypothetical protein